MLSNISLAINFDQTTTNDVQFSSVHFVYLADWLVNTVAAAAKKTPHSDINLKNTTKKTYAHNQK